MKAIAEMPVPVDVEGAWRVSPVRELLSPFPATSIGCYGANETPHQGRHRLELEPGAATSVP